VERLQVLAGDRGQRLRRVGHAVGVKAVDQPVEQHRRDVVGIAAVDLQGRDRLLLLPVDLIRRERRIAHDVVDQVHADGERILHHHRVDIRQIRPRARPHRSADRVDLIGDLLGTARRRPLVEQAGNQPRQP
jgi:hypothetical protein